MPSHKVRMLPQLDALVRTAYPPEGGEITNFPNILPDTLQPVVPAVNLQKGLVAAMALQSSGALAATSQATTVPDGVTRLVLSFSASHNDAANHTLTISVRRGGINFPLAAATLVAANVPVVCLRSFTVMPGDQLRVDADAMGAGANLILTAAWYDYPEGTIFPVLL